MSKKSIYQFIAIIVVLGIAIVSTGFMFATKEEVKETTPEEKLVTLRVQRAEYTIKYFDLEYTGRVLSSKEVNISAQVSGELEAGNINFKKGETFRKGDVLLRVNDDQMQAALMSSRSSFLTSLSRLLPDLEIDFPNEYSKWDTFFNSIKLNKLTPELPSINTEKERVFLASNNVLTSYYSIKQQEITLERHTIRAPFNGAIYTINAEVGAIANPNSPLATLIRTDALEIEVPVKPEDRKKLKSGQMVSIVGDNNGLIEGKIARISPFVDRQTQLVSVFVSVNKNSELMEGEYLKVDFPGNSKQKAIVLPREAMSDNNKVFVVSNSRLVEAKAKVLQVLPDSVVLTGIQEGELVVTESLINLKIGDKVKVLLGR